MLPLRAENGIDAARCCSWAACQSWESSASPPVFGAPRRRINMEMRLEIFQVTSPINWLSSHIFPGKGTLACTVFLLINQRKSPALCLCVCLHLFVCVWAYQVNVMTLCALLPLSLFFRRLLPHYKSQIEQHNSSIYKHTHGYSAAPCRDTQSRRPALFSASDFHHLFCHHCRGRDVSPFERLRDGRADLQHVILKRNSAWLPPISVTTSCYRVTRLCICCKTVVDLFVVIMFLTQHWIEVVWVKYLRWGNVWQERTEGSQHTMR